MITSCCHNDNNLTSCNFQDLHRDVECSFRNIALNIVMMRESWIKIKALFLISVL